MDNGARDKGTTSRSRRIIMLGTSPDTRGGVASVIRVYCESGLFKKWPIDYKVSHIDGTTWMKFSIAAKAFATYVTQLIVKRDFVLHVHSSSRASFWRKTAFILPTLWMGVPVIFHLHGGGFIRFYQDECGPLSKWFIRFVLNKCTRIIVLSEGWRALLTEITSNPELRVIANPCIPHQGSDNSAARRRGLVLFLGRMVESKGLLVLLRAFARVLVSCPSARLICAGDGDLEYFAKTTQSLGISASVDVLGWIDERTRSKLLTEASIFALPSFAEGLPMSILEAMSAAIPIIATPVGGIPEVVRNGVEGILVPISDEVALAQAIEELINNAELGAELGSRARNRFKTTFSADVAIPRLEMIYRELGISPRMAET